MSLRSAWILAAALLASVVVLPARAWSPITVRDGGGAAIGRIDPDGTVRSASGATRGRIEQDGTVRDRSGATRGRVEAGGVLRDASGATVGRVDPDGALRDRGGARVGRLDVCTVRSAAGRATGTFDGCSMIDDRKVMAAYLFFFEPLHRR